MARARASVDPKKLPRLATASRNRCRASRLYCLAIDRASQVCSPSRRGRPARRRLARDGSSGNASATASPFWNRSWNPRSTWIPTDIDRFRYSLAIHNRLQRDFSRGPYARCWRKQSRRREAARCQRSKRPAPRRAISHQRSRRTGPWGVGGETGCVLSRELERLRGHPSQVTDVRTEYCVSDDHR